VRALIVHPGPAYSVADVFQGWCKGLKQNGADIAAFNLGDRLDFYGNAHIKREAKYVKAFQNEDVVRMASLGLKAAVYDWWPDVIFVISAFFVPEDFYEILRARGHKVVIIHTESPYEDDRQIERAERADLNIINDPTNIGKFPGDTIYIPHGYDPDRHYPRPPLPEYASDFCFVGTGYPSRIRFFEQVDWSGIDPAFAGNWQATEKASPIRKFMTHPLDECCPNSESVKLYTSTKVSANLYRREAQRPELSEGWAMTPREVELAACGVFFLRESRGEGDETFPMLPTFSEADGFGDLVGYWVRHEEQRTDAARAARSAIAEFTFANHAAKALRALA
jgi:spore maturation protein CgeB